MLPDTTCPACFAEVERLGPACCAAAPPEDPSTEAGKARPCDYCGTVLIPRVPHPPICLACNHSAAIRLDRIRQ